MTHGSTQSANLATRADVLSLDDQGRFIVCRVCNKRFAAHGGKRPTPVIMNACFRTCAKRRTRAHQSNSATVSRRHSVVHDSTTPQYISRQSSGETANLRGDFATKPNSLAYLLAPAPRATRPAKQLVSAQAAPDKVSSAMRRAQVDISFANLDVGLHNESFSSHGS